MFRGPPPSYGTRGAADTKDEGTSNASGGGGGSAYAWGPEPQFSQTADFDSQPVFRTQSVEDERRNRRRSAAAAAAQTAFDEEGEFWARFVMVTVVLVVGVSVSSLIVGMMESQPKAGGMVRGDGTLRRPESGSKKRDPG